MEQYKPTKKELMNMRKESVRYAQEKIKSLNCAFDKFSRGSNVEGSYMDEKLRYLTAEIKKMQKSMGY